MKNPLPFNVGRRDLIKRSGALALMSPFSYLAQNSSLSDAGTDRQYWVRTVTKIADPVLKALSTHSLKASMPVEAPHSNAQERSEFTHLEALGRLLAGIAPWLECKGITGEEAPLRDHYADLSRAAIDAATDPLSPDYMNFNKGSQPLVDAAFLALAILRAPTELWHKLSKRTQINLIQCLKSTRIIKPGYTNWLLFSATIEACLSTMDEWWDPMRVDYAIRAIESFYKGDGIYGDGPALHCDYYNSFVIHPMLLTTLETIARVSPAWVPFQAPALLRAQRYAQIQERLIAPDGSFPPIGRSLAYRFGAFHLLADMAYRQQLPTSLTPPQVRCALTSVIRRMIEAPGTFDHNGWLTIGFCGHQPEIAEGYISTGSSYLCSVGLVPLGLPQTDPFWSGPAEKWTSQKAWEGIEFAADHAITQ
jgi:hypothetical protein